MIDNQPAHFLIDRDNFERIALQAKLQRANFLRKHVGTAFVMAGSIGLVSVLALVLIPAGNTNYRSTLGTAPQTESQSTKRTMEATAQIEGTAKISKAQRQSGRTQRTRLRSLFVSQVMIAIK